VDEKYSSLLASQALRNFFNLDKSDNIPKELFLILDRIKSRYFKPGQIIIREGDQADSLFIIDKGQADVLSDSSGGVVIGQLGEGDFFGEVALLTGQTRSATVIAKTEIVAFELFRDDLDQVTKAHPHIIGTLLQKLYNRLTESYLALEERNKALQRMSKIREELATLFTSVVLLITCYIFILGVLSNDLIIRHMPEQSSYFISRLIELSVLILAYKIIRNSSLNWKDFGLNTVGAKKAIVESLVISFVVIGILCLGKYFLIRLYPENFPDRQIMSWQYFDYTYITYLVVAPLQEFITRGVVQTSLQRLLVGRHKVLLSILIT